MAPSEAGLSGLPASTGHTRDRAEVLRLNRGRWQIENRSHWVRDVTRREDAGLVRTGKIAQTLALRRTVVLSRLRLEGVTDIARELRRLAAEPAESLCLLGIPDN